MSGKRRIEHSATGRAGLVAAVVLLLCAVPAQADTWAPPERLSAMSADRLTRLLVDPPGSGHDGALPLATLERREPQGWRRTWSGPLDGFMPVDVLVANKGKRFVTLDEHGALGFGPRAVAIYGADGRLLRAFALSDLLPAWYVSVLPTSTSSIQWRREAVLSADGARLLIPVRQPVADADFAAAEHTTTLAIRLADAAVLGLTGDEWQAELGRAGRIARSRCAELRRSAEWQGEVDPSLAAACQAPAAPWGERLATVLGSWLRSVARWFSGTAETART